MSSFASVSIKFFADLKGFSGQMQNVNRQLASVSKDLQRTGATLTKGLTLPLLALGGLGVKTFADFEQEMAKVNAISGASASEFKTLEANARKLGETTRYTATQVAGLQLNYSKLGFNPGEILKVTEATLELSLATGEDLAESATVAASTLRGFGLDASQTQRVVDVMASSFSSSALNLEKFKTSMSVLAPVAKTANVSLEEATGLLSTLVNAGVDATTAGTGLRNVFLDIADKGLTMDEALSQIQNSTNKNKTAMELFGKRGATVANILADNVVEAREFTKAYSDAEGSAKRMAGIMDNTLQGSFFRLKSAVEGAFISIGESLAPALRSLSDAVSGLVGRFNALSPQTKKFIVILGGVAAAVGPLLALAGTILPAITTGFALLTGPIGLVIAGLIAISAVIYKNWAPIKQTLVDIRNYFTDLYNESLVFRVGVEAVINVFKDLFAVGKFVFETLKNVIGNFIESIVGGFKTFGAVVKAALTGEFSSIPDILKANAKESTKVFAGFTAELANDWRNLTDGIAKNGQDAIASITQRKKITFVKDNVDATGLTDAVSEGVSKGLVDGLTSGASGGVVDSTPQVTALNTGEASGLTEIQSPLTAIVAALPEQLVQIDEAFLLFQEQLLDFENTSGSIIESTAETFAAGFGNLIAGIVRGANPLRGFAKLILTTIGDLLQQLGKAAIQIGITMKGLKSAFSSPLGAIAAGVAAIALGGIIKSFVPEGFANGGIVGGQSFYGDKILARVNSGELILNTDQQKALYGQLNTSAVVGGATQSIADVQIKGEDLVLVFDRAKNNLSRQS